jgi:hypothetical protein
MGLLDDINYALVSNSYLGENKKANKLNNSVMNEASIQEWKPDSERIGGHALQAPLFSPDDIIGSGIASKVSGLLGKSAIAGVVLPKAEEEMLIKLTAMQNGEKVRPVVKNGLLTTDDQHKAINDYFTKLTAGKQPIHPTNERDIALGHVYDSRMSGKVKASGDVADRFGPAEATKMVVSGGENSSIVKTNAKGKPYLEGVYVDPATGKSYPVELPFSADFTTGKQWVSGVVPIGLKKK